MDVEVLCGTIHSVGAVAVVARVAGGGSVFVHVDGDVRRELAEPLFDVAGLLARELAPRSLFHTRALLP